MTRFDLWIICLCSGSCNAGLAFGAALAQPPVGVRQWCGFGFLIGSGFLMWLLGIWKMCRLREAIQGVVENKEVPQ